MTSVKNDHLQVMETITGKFYKNPLKIAIRGDGKSPDLVGWLFWV